MEGVVRKRFGVFRFGQLDEGQGEDASIHWCTACSLRFGSHDDRAYGFQLGSYPPALAGRQSRCFPGHLGPARRRGGRSRRLVDLPVTLNAPGESTVTVATPPPQDGQRGIRRCEFPNSAYVAKSGTLTFTPGETTQVVKITLVELPAQPQLRAFSRSPSNSRATAQDPRS